jgi:hypothetical protein
MTHSSHIRAARRRLAVLGVTLALAGCSGASLPDITAGSDAADPHAAGTAPAYVPVTAGTVNHQPVEPKTWRDMNERVAPRAGRTP